MRRGACCGAGGVMQAARARAREKRGMAGTRYVPAEVLRRGEGVPPAAAGAAVVCVRRRRYGATLGTGARSNILQVGRKRSGREWQVREGRQVRMAQAGREAGGHRQNGGDLEESGGIRHKRQAW